MTTCTTTPAGKTDTGRTPPTTYRFDRRRYERHAASGQVTCQRCDHDPRIYQHPVCSLNLCDLSDGGLSALCDVPLELNERITVYFPPHGPDSGFDLPGHIVRCRPTDQGYHVAVSFDLPQAA